MRIELCLLCLLVNEALLPKYTTNAMRSYNHDLVYFRLRNSCKSKKSSHALSLTIKLGVLRFQLLQIRRPLTICTEPPAKARVSDSNFTAGSSKKCGLKTKHPALRNNPSGPNMYRSFYHSNGGFIPNPDYPTQT